MTPMAATLSDEDMADLAAYFSSQTRRPTGETEPSKLKLGQTVYRAGVASTRPCRRAPAATARQARAIPAAAMQRIGGQHATYVALQLRAYKTGTRATDPNEMMRTVAREALRRGNRRGRFVCPGPALNLRPRRQSHPTI